MAQDRPAVFRQPLISRIMASAHGVRQEELVFIACVLVSSAVAAMVTLSGIMKLARSPQMVELIGGLGVPLSWFPWLATAEFAGAVGLVVGFFVAPIGIAAGVGLVLYAAGAITTHVRAGDLAGVKGAVLLLVLSVA